MTLLQVAKRYSKPCIRKSCIQLANSFLPFVGLLFAMYWVYDIHYGLVVALAIPTAGFLLRLFIIQHDCGHGSFFYSENLNAWVGRVIGLFTLTPYTFWKTHHSIHHASSGNLDRRNIGDIPTMTVEEYTTSTRFNKILYRFYRNPFALLLIGAPGLFIIVHRFPWYVPFKEKSLWKSILYYDVALVAAFAALTLWLGPSVFFIYLPVICFAAMAGTFMFFVQHQFEGTYWHRDNHWNFVEAAMEGCSYYKLPRILNWFTGNIAFHHIHHLCSKIPNYELKKCFRENEAFQNAKTLRLRDAFHCFRLALWDENTRSLVPFKQAKRNKIGA